MFVSFQEYIRIFVEVNTHCPSDIPNDLKIFFLNVLLQYIVRCRGEPAQLSANAPADA